MSKCKHPGLSYWFLMLFLFLLACHHRPNPPVKPKEKDIVEQPEALNVTITHNMQTALEFVLANNGRLNDSIVFGRDSLVNQFYQSRNYEPIWCNQEKWSPVSDSLLDFIGHSLEYGLYPSDYHYKILNSIRQQTTTDTLAAKDAALWSRGELLLTDAFFHLCYHLHKGRLPYDSVTLRKDTLTTASYLNLFQQAQQTGNISAIMHDLEPRLPYYDSMKTGLKDFLESMDTLRKYTYVVYPCYDSAKLYNNLQQRLFEAGIVRSPTEKMDTAEWKRAIGFYQRIKGLTVTGKINENTAKSLNNTAWEKFRRIAIALDRYKLLPDTMPATYIWINIPSYSMKIVDSDSVKLESRVIVGQPRTRTPLLTSQVSNFITYPQWTVPYSIIFHEMLPKIQVSTDYLRKQNLIVVDAADSVLNPDAINWKKLNKNNFPYVLKQRQGDDNSLGVLKFNFANKYSVYLHDTNVRWLFSKENRALSHGCVRVKEFMKLADFLVRNDTLKFPPDTLRSWITRREKHVISGFPKVPIFIRYFTCDVKNGRIRFFDDVYGEDKLLAERYFANKNLQ